MAFVVVFLGFMTSLQAQNAISLGTFEEGRQVSGPLMLSQGEGWKRSLYIYPKEAIISGLASSYENAHNSEEFESKLERTYNGEAAFYFNSLAMLRVSDEYNIVPNTSKLRIYVKNTEASGFGGAAIWKEEVHDAVLVFDGDPSDLIGYSNGFTNFYFSKAVPWTGNNLEVIFEFYTSLGNESAEPLQLASTDRIAATFRNSEIIFDKSQGLIATGSNHPPANNQFNTTVSEHPDLKLGFTTNIGLSYLPVGSGKIEEEQTSPIRNGATGWNRNMYIYPWTMLSGIKSGSFINSLELYRLNETKELANGNELRIFVKNCVDYTFDQNASTDWYNLVNDATLVYDGDPKDIVGNTSGYKLFPFTNPFQYAGDNLQVFFEYIKTNDNRGNDNMQWAGSNPETDNDLDFNQGMYYMKADGSVPNGNTNLSDFSGTIPTLRLGNTSAGVAKQAITDVSASNGAVINNGKRTYVINQLLYKPNKGEAITDDQPFTASNGKVFNFNYVLLHKLAQTGNSNEQYLQGKLTARMGSNVVENHKIDLDINTSAGNLQNAGSMVSYGDPASLVSLKYNNENYMAVAIPIYTEIQSSLTDFSFTGYAQNSILQLIAGSDLNNVDTASIKAFGNRFDSATNISSTANRMVVSGGLVVNKPSANATVLASNSGTNSTESSYYIQHPINGTGMLDGYDYIPNREETGYDYNYILLHEAYDNSNNRIYPDPLDQDHYVMGKITAFSGSHDEENAKLSLEVNTASANTSNLGNLLTYNGNGYELVKLIYRGKLFLAIKIPATFRLYDASFTGNLKNAYLYVACCKDDILEVQFLTTEYEDNTFSGDVGIGTSRPVHRLDVVTDKQTENNEIYSSAQEGSATIGLKNNMKTWEISTLGANFSENEGDFSITDSVKSPFQPRLLIKKETGKVGLGTNDPKAAFHLQDNDNSDANLLIGSTSNLNSNNDEGISIYSKDQTNTSTKPLRLEGSFIGINQQGNGQVYIGKVSGRTISPNYLMDVAGKVRADKVTINSSGADFVFDSSYHLPTLKAVEKFVKKEHHLPGIETAKNMQINGIDIGENQTKLLQKIEELTLYMIEQNKKIEKLEKEVKKYRKK